MSHVFISYSHEDKKQLTNFVEKLEQVGFKKSGEDKDIWIDSSGIEGGEDWRGEIDLALEESFAVVILLTKHSIKSNFVLYEWAWALGNDIRVSPILLEDIKKKDLPRRSKHPLFDRKQFKDWNVISDQENLITQLKDLQKLSPLDKSLGIAIGELILPTLILSHVVLWCYPYANPDHIVSHRDFFNLLGQAVYETISCYRQKLTDFWLDKSSAFNRKQKRLYVDLIQKLEEIWDLLRTLHYVTQTNFQEDLSLLGYEEKSLSQPISELSKFQEELDKMIPSLNADLNTFEEFRSYLSHISSRKYTQDELKNIRFFSSADEALKSLSKEQREILEQVINLVIQQ